MSNKTNISWTDRTWNPLRGCSKVSAGCRNCYAENMANRFSGPGQPYEGTITDGRWNGKIRLVPEVLNQPIRWQRPSRIFVNSMSDLFHDNVPDDYIDQVFAVMALAPHHTFQILTKRPARMLEYMTKPSSPFSIDKLGDLSPWMEQWGWISPEDAANVAPPGSTLPKWPEWPLPNVWLGVSVEDQNAADERIPLLLQTPAAIRWLSCEPLLGQVNLFKAGALEGGFTCEAEFSAHGNVDWVVVGGESGPHARPMHPDWARSLRDQCEFAGVPFHFKQWGEWTTADCSNFDPIKHLLIGIGLDGKDHSRTPHEQLPEGVQLLAKVGKGAAGRELDGRVWDEYPEQQE